MLVQDFLEFRAAELPEKVALVCRNQRFTYGELDGMANRLANGLRSLGVGRGDRVVLHLDNSVECVVGIFATLKIGGIFVPIYETTKADRLLAVLNNCRAKVLLANAHDRLKALFNRQPVAAPSLRAIVVCGAQADSFDLPHMDHVSFAAIQERSSGLRPARTGIDLDLACLIYTSGTTGDPKGVMCGHDNVVFVTDSVIEYLENGIDDVILSVLPLSFSYGLYQVFMTFRFGGTLVLCDGFAFPATVVERMAKERVVGFPGVPTIFAALLKLDFGRYDLSSLRYLTNAASALPVAQVGEIGRRLPGARLYSMYGLTETKRALYLPPEQLGIRPGSVGKAIPGTEVWLEDGEGQELGPGAVGELVVRGRHVMRGYWEDPKGSAERFRPAKLPGENICHTGDLFRKDEAGFYYFVSRKDDIIKCRGEKVVPREVEQVICGLNGVAEAAVIGVDDPVLGQAVKAFVVVEGSALTATQILAHCRLHLEDYMVPKHLEFRESFPRTASGKIRKAELV